MERAVRSEPKDVSLIQLIANPEKYDGALVRVIGFVNLEFEGNAIYVNHLDEKYAISSNGLWLETTEHPVESSISGTYALIEGTFNAGDRGHRDQFSGAIESIGRAQVWARMEGRKPSGSVEKIGEIGDDK